MHIHLYQDESFTVVSGRLRAYVGSLKKEPLDVVPKDGEVTLPKCVAHTFFPVVEDGDLIVKIRVTPNDGG
jgi:mannose-6-phosphate isomerase-like protein (cupin superfamily)